jgi:hypothetical protein
VKTSIGQFANRPEPSDQFDISDETGAGIRPFNEVVAQQRIARKALIKYRV